MIVSTFDRRAPIPRFLGMAAALLAVLSTAPRLHAQAAASVELDAAHAARVTCDADNGGVTLPPGFCAVVVADQVGLARHLVVTPNGNLYGAAARGVLPAHRPGRADGKDLRPVREMTTSVRLCPESRHLPCVVHTRRIRVFRLGIGSDVHRAE